MKRFLSWFRSPGGALIALGALTQVSRWAAVLWRWLTEWETARAIWIDAGGSMPLLVSMVSSIWFSPALIVAGFAYTVSRWRLDATGRGRAYGQLMDGIGWFVFAAAAVLVVSTILFDSFLTGSGASDFAQYVKNQRTERHLTASETQKIVDTFKKIDPPFKIMVFAIENPEAIAYGREFMDAFHRANQTVNGKSPDSPAYELGAPSQARLYSPKMHGLFIGAKSNANIAESPEAIRFANALNDAGVKVAAFSGWEGLGPEGFNFIIGPP
jgi:hypothetical protein